MGNRKSHPSKVGPYMAKPIPFNKPFVVGKELYNIATSVMNAHISGDGPFAQACAEKLSHFCGGAPVVMTPSCTSALEMACMAIDLKPGDEVILPSFTFTSTANAIALRGATPVFCDIRQDNFNLDEAKVAACISKNTKAILPVHYAGQGCEMDALAELAQKHGLTIIEDAAQGVGAYHHGRHLGSFGDLAAFSFHETKNIMCGEGGALVINNPEFAERIEIIREKGTNRSAFLQGQVDKYTWVDLGSSFLPSELQMAFLDAQLEQVKQITKKRKKAFDRYHRLLEPLEQAGVLRRPITLPQNQINYHLYPILLNSLDQRTGLIQFLANLKIQPVFHYVPLHNSPAGKKFGKTPHAMETTENVGDRLLRLPIYFEISKQEIQRVVRGIEAFFNGEKHSKNRSKGPQ